MQYAKISGDWRRRRDRRITLLLAVACMFGGVWVRSAVAQAISNAITITTPASGSIVTPGQSLQVSVNVSAGTRFNAIQVIGEDIGISPAKQTPPYSFALTIPNNVIGPKNITALGIIGQDNGVFSEPVIVDVEIPTVLTNLDVNPPQISFTFVGNQANLTVFGTFADGSQANIRHSSYTSYATNDATVATVTGGVVTAVGAGTTSIVVEYGGLSVSVPVAVLGTFAGTPGSSDCHGKAVSALAERYADLAAAANALGYPSVSALQDAIRAYCGG